MKKSAILLLLLCFSTAIKAQLKIEFSEVTKPVGGFGGFYPISENEFYAVRTTGALRGTTQLARYKNYQEVAASKVKMTVGTGSATWVTSAMVDENVIVFFSDRSAKGDSKSDFLYVQKFNKDCLPDGAPKELSSIEVLKSWKKGGGSYSVLASANENFFCVEYLIPGKKDENDRFVYKIFSKDFKVVTEGEYQVPYDTKISDISRRFLSNTGDYFLSCNIYDLGDKKRVKDFSLIDKVILLHIKDNDVEEMAMEIDGRRAIQMNYSSDGKGILTFTGLYGEKKQAGIKGIFYFRYDFKNKKQIDSGFEPFSKEFITKGWTDKQKEKADKKQKKGKAEPQLYNYKIRDLMTLADGSIIGLMEQYYVQVVTTTDPKTGATTTRYIYHYDDLIAYKIKADGTFDWINKIPKRQTSQNDGGFLSSVYSFLKDGKMIIMFNDHVKNYDTKGDYNGETYGVVYRKKTNVVAYLDLNVETGEYKRKLALSPETVNQYAVPKSFEYDSKTNQIWMTFRPKGKRFQFGKLEL
ncbi:MAG: hypothetical protein PHQ74_07645 [Crocinitomicaceae bacterium]|nr:hypothetical protein [Crocinitomicaceae bacterium]